MPEERPPIMYELMETAVLAQITVFDTRNTQTTDGETAVTIEGRIGDEEENDAEWASFGLIFTLSALSFSDARPRGYSEEDFDSTDEWTVGDMLGHLRYVRGELQFYADYVRGRMMKTSITIRSDGTFTLETVNRGKTATRWLSKIQGKKTLAVVKG